MKGIMGIGHMAVRVKDVARSLAFYEGQLGFREVMRLDKDGRLWLLYLQISGEQFIEVFPEAEGERSPGIQDIGWNHLCLTVDNLDDTLARIEAAGIALFRPKKLGADGNLQAWVEDPDGNRIELMQMMPDCMQRQALAKLKTLV